MISCAIQMWEVVTYFFMVSVLKLGYQSKTNVLIIVIHCMNARTMKTWKYSSGSHLHFPWHLWWQQKEKEIAFYPWLDYATMLTNTLPLAQEMLLCGVIFNIIITKSNSELEGGEGVQMTWPFEYFQVSLHITVHPLGLKGNVCALPYGMEQIL